MKREERYKSKEGEESDQPMERPRRSNYGTVVERLVMGFDEKDMYMDNTANY